MNCPQRLLCALYVSSSSGLALTTVHEFRHGPWWAAGLFAAASLVPLVAVVREAEPRAPATERRLRGVGPGTDDDVVRGELDAACCDRWWTSCGTEHDAACPHRVPRSSAA
ncbi:hypothetical protein [Streptomyces sp. NBC_00140]|uniref:hypothetical protein n=1 Tax=Streptomyces sp. NBC_00140 TaxID=2975664 RepID=UPI00224C8F18|nr:hypothetical protein [Streptomyces sp. NBC_00140]MCX5329329.1 hypothetical protein [Streptomyces sp. NBC_00140]